MANKALSAASLPKRGPGDGHVGLSSQADAKRLALCGSN